jgi:hypothetical protein
MGLLAAGWMLEALEEREHGTPQKPKLHKAQPELVRRMSTARAAKARRKDGKARKNT